MSIENHEPLTVNRKNGDAFVVISLEDYNAEQETLYILNNNSLMGQIEKSLQTYKNRTGYTPSEDELNLDNIVAWCAITPSPTFKQQNSAKRINNIKQPKLYFLINKFSNELDWLFKL